MSVVETNAAINNAPAVAEAIADELNPTKISHTARTISFRISGTPTRLDRAENILRGKFKAKQSLSCGVCGVKYQLADNTELFRAATASGGDLVEYFVDEEDSPERGNSNL